LGIWKKVLTVQEISTLYNYGLGLSYPFNAPLVKLTEESEYPSEFIDYDEVKNSESEIFLFPNPANNEINISNVNSPNALILIYNLQGKLEIKLQTNGLPIDISNLKKGIYLVKLIDDHKILINRLIKE
jgi:hypothetical protein